MAETRDRKAPNKIHDNILVLTIHSELTELEVSIFADKREKFKC